MSHSQNQIPAAVPRALRPPFTQRSAFASRVSADLEKVLGHLDPKTRKQEVEVLTNLFEKEPLLSLSAFWLESVPQERFGKAKHMLEWIDLLCALIERYATITKRKQTKGVSWKADCLKGMLDKLKRMPGKLWDGRDSWKKFTDSLVNEAKPRICNPITKEYCRKEGCDLENFRKLGIFIKSGENVWEGWYDFPLKLLRSLDAGSLSKLLTTGSIHQKEIALHAMRMDLLAQHQQYRAGLNNQRPAWHALKYLVMRLGDFELAKKADEALTPFHPFEDSMVSELDAAEKSNKSRQRRPNAKPRKPR